MSCLSPCQCAGRLKLGQFRRSKRARGTRRLECRCGKRHAALGCYHVSLSHTQRCSSRIDLGGGAANFCGRRCSGCNNLLAQCSDRVQRALGEERDAGRRGGSSKQVEILRSECQSSRQCLRGASGPVNPSDPGLHGVV
ncbi:hypothetical protein D3C71_1608620 [compost metagenome]